jgi:chromosome segregation ATPase
MENNVKATIEKRLNELREKKNSLVEKMRMTDNKCAKLKREIESLKREYEDCDEIGDNYRTKLNQIEDEIHGLSGKYSGGRRRNHKKTKKAKRKGRYSRRN